METNNKEQPGLSVTLNPDTLFIGTAPGQTSVGNLAFIFKNTGAPVALKKIGILLPVNAEIAKSQITSFRAQPAIISLGGSAEHIEAFGALLKMKITCAKYITRWKTRPL